VLHWRREAHDPRCPAHVTLRATPGLVSLRAGRVAVAVEAALARSSTSTFRVLQFSVQTNHVHLLVEADGGLAFIRGCQGLAIRLAKAVNRVLRRAGAVWAERYHARHLTTPKAVRACLVYVLQNFRKHVSGARGLDVHSSARWFRGWRTPVEMPGGRSPVAAPRTWLARVGWRRHGALGMDEAPARGGRRKS
jgi:REP element-mobilizing transposase RayT